MMESEVTSGAMLLAPEKQDADHKKPHAAAGDGAERGRTTTRRQAIRITDLPPPGITRWVIRRKAQVVAAVESGSISLEEICDRYSVSVEEFQSWQRSLQRHGLYGLRTTRAQIYRSSNDSAKDEGSGQS
jgi:transposase-like protein